jgi:3-oxoacyl-[acyl-carrier protein] reductase
MPDYTHVCADVGDENQVRRLMRQIQEQYHYLDVAINNAGIAAMNHSLLTPAETFDRIMTTNVRGAFLISRESAKLMRKGGYGRIVNLSSVAARMDLEGESIYAASKRAVESLTRVLSREFAAFGITVNAVGPTPIETDLIRDVPAGRIEALVRRLAIKRLGRPSDVWNVIDFLTRPESDYITGQVIYLGGV